MFVLLVKQKTNFCVFFSRHDFFSSPIQKIVSRFFFSSLAANFSLRTPNHQKKERLKPFEQQNEYIIYRIHPNDDYRHDHHKRLDVVVVATIAIATTYHRTIILSDHRTTHRSTGTFTDNISTTIPTICSSSSATTSKKKQQ